MKKEELRKHLAKRLSRENNSWTFNGREFEAFYRCDINPVSALVRFKSVIDEITVELIIDHIYGYYVKKPMLIEKFNGKECYSEAIDWLTEEIGGRIEAINGHTEEVTKNQMIYERAVAIAAQKI